MVSATHCLGFLSTPSMAVTLAPPLPPVLQFCPFYLPDRSWPCTLSPSIFPLPWCVALSNSCVGGPQPLPALSASRLVSLTATPCRHQRELKAFARRGSSPTAGCLIWQARALPRTPPPPGGPPLHSVDSSYRLLDLTQSRSHSRPQPSPSL